MKKTAILVIASLSKPLYVHYIDTYWTALIRHTNAHTPHIRVYLLFEYGTDLGRFAHLADNIIVDRYRDFDDLVDPRFQTEIIPGILCKTIHAFERLQHDYDVFFRTNLSSMLRLDWFDRFVQEKERFCYSGNWIWTDALRDDLLYRDRVGPDRSIETLEELDDYEGNSFISGSGFFLGAREVRSLVERKDRIRYDLIDDVAIGLMFREHEFLPGFSMIVRPHQSVTDIRKAIRNSQAAHVRIQHFPVEKAQALWDTIARGEVWLARRPSGGEQPTLAVHFPLFDHQEARSNEMRLVYEGLARHPRVTLVGDPEAADCIVLCQNHIVEHCPLYTRFRPLKDRYKHKTVLMDFDDYPHQVFDQEDFGWLLYFKRSTVDRGSNTVVDYGGLPVIPTSYAVLDAWARCPEQDEGDDARPIAISCLFEDGVVTSPVFSRVRGRLLQFARSLRARHLMPMQIGTVSEPGPVGRSGVDERYRECLLNSKIVLHANPDPWEGDARLWEALAAGALVCVDRMVQPIDYPLVDGEHVVFYDPTDEGLADLERRIIHFLLNEEERAEIAAQGRAFALAHHRSQNRIDAMVQRLLDRVDIGVEIGVEYGPGSGKSAQHEGARGDRSRLTAARQRA